MMSVVVRHFCLLVLLLGTTLAEAAELRVCSQNLHNYLAPAQIRDDKKRARALRDEAALVERFLEARCDVIAVQEVLGRDEREGLSHLRVLAAQLGRQAQRKVQAYVGHSRDRIRNGFLVVGDELQHVQVETLDDVGLPRLQPKGPPHYFRRPPLRLIAHLKSETKTELVLFNMHLKSKADGWKDASGTQFEALRMEMAEALRLQAKDQVAASRIVMVLGDRNTSETAAAAMILEGVRELRDFQEGGCSLDAELQPRCPASQGLRPPEFTALLHEANKRCASCPRLSSYRYRGNVSLLDEILVHRSALPRLVDGRDRLRVGTSGVFSRGSDHKLLWAAVQVGE